MRGEAVGRASGDDDLGVAGVLATFDIRAFRPVQFRKLIRQHGGRGIVQDENIDHPFRFRSLPFLQMARTVFSTTLSQLANSFRTFILRRSSRAPSNL